MSERGLSECQRLRRDVELALAGPDPVRVLPLLHRLAARAEEGSDESVFAHRQLAEILLERDPWRAALHARRVTGIRPDDDRAWAALALSQSLLGNHRFAARALACAVERAPDNPWYAHNLGHTLDVALDRPREAVRHLRRAYHRSGQNAEVATSLAHALARAGRTRAARTLLARVLKSNPAPERRALMRWIEAGADGCAPVVSGVQLLATREPDSPPRSRVRGHRRWLQGSLRRGLPRLPLDEAQRLAATNLAREAAQRKPPTDERGADAIAAAAAWTIIARAGIPLSQAEVAACFRTSASTLRQQLGSVKRPLNVKRS
ncbi:MAG TPA: tetratricopeptide repeat protein [Polyangiaceae bacterium]